MNRDSCFWSSSPLSETLYLYRNSHKYETIIGAKFVKGMMVATSGTAVVI